MSLKQEYRNTESGYQTMLSETNKNMVRTDLWVKECVGGWEGSNQGKNQSPEFWYDENR